MFLNFYNFPMSPIVNRVPLPVRVIAESTVSPPPEPAMLETSYSIKLSFFDLHWIPLQPVKRLLFYETSSSFSPLLIQNMKNSLSSALGRYRPLAGKLVYSPESTELEIECREGDGVVFLEAESEGDFHRLARDDVHDAATFGALVPNLETTKLPSRLLSVQVTRFVGVGVAVGLCVHHCAVDGNAMWRFVKSWADICKSGDHTVGPRVLWDRSPIRGSFGLMISKFYLEMLAPSLPKLTLTTFSDHDPTQLMRRTFILTPANIRSLKARVSHSNNHNISTVSTFVAVSTHAWICSNRARRLEDNEESCLLFLVDCRPHLDPPLEEGFFANCVRPCLLRAKGFQLLGEDGFIYSTMAIQRAVHEVISDPLRDCKNWIDYPFGLPPSFMTVSSSPRFKIYETDFGSGRPRRVELVSMNSEGSVVLADARDEEGGLQVSIALSPTHMDMFTSLFLDV
ncbi:phenolic glucoside malonyltransferase 2-like [Tasmannia lanceolata]|uniref:phenolic glucoside malonyltransferase 2-like n=1 Tax=Tasmannia lanceolata TaxID=3420 RepID=UPI0040634E65